MNALETAARPRLSLTITDPSTLTEDDVAAVLAFMSVRSGARVASSCETVDAPRSQIGDVSIPVAGSPGAFPLPEKDSAGLPWDGRIHAGTKARNADGTWRMS